MAARNEGFQTWLSSLVQRTMLRSEPGRGKYTSNWWLLLAKEILRVTKDQLSSGDKTSVTSGDVTFFFRYSPYLVEAEKFTFTLISAHDPKKVWHH